MSLDQNQPATPDGPAKGPNPQLMPPQGVLLGAAAGCAVAVFLVLAQDSFRFSGSRREMADLGDLFSKLLWFGVGGIVIGGLLTYWLIRKSGR